MIVNWTREIVNVNCNSYLPVFNILTITISEWGGYLYGCSTFCDGCFGKIFILLDWEYKATLSVYRHPQNVKLFPTLTASFSRPLRCLADSHSSVSCSNKRKLTNLIAISMPSLYGSYKTHVYHLSYRITCKLFRWQKCSRSFDAERRMR